MHPADWWKREVDIAVQKLRFSSYEDELMEMNVQQVVAESIENSLYEQVPVVRRQSGESTARATQPQLNSGGERSIKRPSFLTLNVTGICGRAQPIAIHFGTTLDEALAMAVKLVPVWLQKNCRAFCFEGLDGGMWSGAWPERRWDVVRERRDRG